LYEGNIFLNSDVTKKTYDSGVILGVDDASFSWTVKELPTRNTWRMQIRNGGNWSEISLYRRP